MDAKENAFVLWEKQVLEKGHLTAKSSLFLSSNLLLQSHLKAMGSRKFLGISISLVLINMAAIMERADENLLPSVYKEVSETFNAGPSDLGYLTFIRNFVQGLSSPLAGILVLNYDRPAIIAAGTLCWSLSTAAVAASQKFSQVAIWRAVNGFGLAIVIPALQSFIADIYMDGARGRGFGLLNLVGYIGGTGGAALATVMAAHQFWGLPGWRAAFVMMASLSLLIGCLVYLFVIDPRRNKSIGIEAAENFERVQLMDKGDISASSIWIESWKAMRSVLKLKTFQIIVLQGIIGSSPWTAMVFFTMWFELIGFDHNTAAALWSMFNIACALGSALGGILADRMSQRYPHTGRVICAQFSAFMAIPFSWFLLKVIPQSINSYYIYAATLSLMGLTISWCGYAVNAPIFAEVVPMKHRTMIYAFDRAFEGGVSAFAAPLVGILAEKFFGYDPAKGAASDATALSKGLLAMTTVPFTLCCLCYTPLYVVFRKDRENARTSDINDEEVI